MAKQTKPSLISAPKTLVHYTSIEVLNALIYGAIKSGQPYFTFHLSLLTEMNDKDEGVLLKEAFFDTKCNSCYENIWQQCENSQRPFVLSTIRSSNEDRISGSLPMWKMYGNDCAGVMIKFDFGRLQDFCRQNGLILRPCHYCTSAGITTVARNITNALRHGADPQETIEDLFIQNSLTKRAWWSYENEWRIIAPTPASKALQKLTDKGIKQFVELPIPIDCITAIFFGPKATAVNKQVINCVCQLFHQIKGYKYPIAISKSTIQIR